MRDFQYRELTAVRSIYTAFSNPRVSRWWIVATKKRDKDTSLDTPWIWSLVDEDRARLNRDPRVTYATRTSDDGKRYDLLVTRIRS